MDDLERLFGAYREALPDPEPSSGFTPAIWRKIEARRSPVRLFRRLAEAFVTVAAVITVLIGTFLIPRMQSAPVYSASYVDVLAAGSSDAPDYAEVFRADVPVEAPQR
jgi:hypothetical protein